MKIFGFAFCLRNVSCSTLYSLEGIANKRLLWGEKSIEDYCRFLVEEQPTHILGTGIYTGKDKEHVHIEAKCSNKFRSKLIDGSAFCELELKPFLQPTKILKYSEDMRTSYCNFISYRIMSLISSRKLSSRYTFLHIPKYFNPKVVSDEIQIQISTLNTTTDIV